MIKKLTKGEVISAEHNLLSVKFMNFAAYYVVYQTCLGALYKKGSLPWYSHSEEVSLFGVFAVDSKVIFQDNNTLHGNSADSGGGVFAWLSDVTFHNNNTLDGNAARYHGGGVYAQHSDVTFHNNSTLHGNSAGYGGGVSAVDSHVRFSGTLSIPVHHST